jgi:sporulation protein YlmC with PRC-barrel domain
LRKDKEVAVPERTPITDGVCGRVTQVVLDPIKDEVTHLIVEPEHRQGLGRLVSMDLTEVAADHVDLRCTRAEFDDLQVAEEVRFLPGTEGYPGFESNQMLLLPYFGGNTTEPVVEDTLPMGEVSVQRGEKVYATDGLIGEVEGLVADRRNYHVTHIVLKEGHLFSHKDVAIPIHAVRAVDADGIRLSMRKHDVGDLPPVEYQHPG